MPVSGIRGTYNFSLGSHLCLFYRRPDEFLQVTASFLKEGLNNQELCIWVLPPPITIPLAFDALSYHGLDGTERQATQQLQIILAQDWYSSANFTVEHALSQLATLPLKARQLGYASVRAVGGPGPFTSERFRQAFLQYERQATEVIAGEPFIGLCCYASPHCLETDMFDIMRVHPQALLRTISGWVTI